MSAKKVLFICTSADKYETSDAKTGSWMEEVAAPYYILKNKGFDVTVASIKGGEVPFDDASLNPPFLTEDAQKFRSDSAAMEQVRSSKKLDDVNAADYDAVFLPGGHGTVFDLPNSQLLAKQLSDAWAKGRIVSAVCHGPVGLVNVKDASGEPIVKGRKVTGFCNTEEKAVGKDGLVPYLLEDKLKELGGDYSKGDDWQVYVQRDGQLITGQNPQSSAKVGELIAEALSA